jgi:hypothetical protein
VQNNRRVDIIIALGMAKEGFDWIWCEHANGRLSVELNRNRADYGRATRDAPGKTRAVHERLPSRTLPKKQSGGGERYPKAIAASLLMEQVLAPRFEFKPKHQESGLPGSTTAKAAMTPTGAMSASTGRDTSDRDQRPRRTPGKEATRICQRI